MADENSVVVSYEVAHEDADRFLDSWEKVNDFLGEQAGLHSQDFPGLVVARLQNVLPPPLGQWESTPGPVDEYFGPKTTKAVKVLPARVTRPHASGAGP